jgi:hypothetical protein
MSKIVSSVDGAHYMQNPILDALRKKYGNITTVNRADPHAFIALFSFWGHEKDKMPRVKKRIMLCGEPKSCAKISANVVVDCKQVPGRRPPQAKFVYYPFYVWSFAERFQNRPQDLLHKATAESIRSQKSKFCAFMYSNEIPHRNRFFDLLSQYKKVDALGKCRNPNKNVQTDRRLYKPGVQTYNDAAVRKYKPYKFVIAVENELSLKGYVTEKIVSPMLAGAIPIYWGCKEVRDHFNPKAFIDVSQFPSPQAAVEEVKRVDQDDEAYLAMLREPWFTGNKLPCYFNEDYLKNRL